MKNQMKHRLAAGAASCLLAVGILAATLTGCRGAGEKLAQNNTGSSDGATGTEADAGAGPSAKGRYMEEEIPLPDGLGQASLISCVSGEDRSLEFFFKNEGELISAVYKSGEWSQQKLPLQTEDVSDIETITNVVKGKDGKYYIGGMGTGSAYHLYTSDGNGGVQKVYEEVFRVPDGKSFWLMPDFLAILSDGSLLLSTMDDAAVYSTDGKRRVSFAQDAGRSNVRNSAYVSDDSYLTMLNGQIISYDLKTGEQVGSYLIPNQADNENSNSDMSLYEDEDGSVFAAGQNGLYHLLKGGTIWEQLIDGSLNSMGRPDIFLRHFYPGADLEYYTVSQKSEVGETVFLRYTYDENVNAIPPEALTIYTLRDSASVRQAASMLQKDNPNVRIDLRIAVADPEEKVTEDVVRALNTELLNGKGADVLILDGLPADIYREKGILLDLSGVLKEVEPALIDNLTSGFKAEDGGIYYLPARLNLPVIYGRPEAVKALTSLEAMEAYNGSVPLLVQNTYGNAIRLTARTCYTELFDKTGALKEGVLKKWLTAVKSAGDKSGFKSEYTLEELERMNLSTYAETNGYGLQGAYDMAGGVCAAAAELLTSIDGSLLTVAAAVQDGYGIEGISGTYIPSVLVGINSSTGKKETAEEFVKILLSPQVQNEVLWDGFSVRKDSLKLWSENVKDVSASTSRRGSDIFLYGEWPTKERRDEIISLVENASVPVMIDAAVIDMIVTGSKGYLDGKEPLDSAVQTIESQIRLYKSEKE